MTADGSLEANNKDTSGYENAEPRNEKRRRHAKQIMLVISASISYFVMGMTLTWPNVLDSHLAKDNSTLFGTHLDLEGWQMDMLNSLVSIGSVFGLLTAGWVVRKLGRQKSLTVAVLPGLLGWASLGLALNTTMLLVGRFCDGVTSGMVTLTVMTYATEIPDATIRGTVTTATCLMFLFGASFCVGMSLFITWYAVALGNVAVLLTYSFLIVPFLPESPTFFIITDRQEEAAKVLKSLRGNYINLDTEIKLLKKMNEEAFGDTTWSFVLQKKVQKRILVLSVLFLVQAFSGTAVLRANAVRILEASGVTGNSDVFATLLLLLPIAGAFVLSWMVDSLGRRICLITSLAFMMVSYVALGTSVYLRTQPFVSVIPLELNDTALPPPYHLELSDDTGWWITLTSLIVCIFAMNIGIESLPWQLSSEYFPTSIRSQAMSLSVTLGCIIAAIALQLYSIMDAALTTAGLFWCYAIVSAVGVAFTVLCVPETARKMVG